jgi:hypothetical protein
MLPGILADDSCNTAHMQRSLPVGPTLDIRDARSHCNPLYGFEQAQEWGMAIFELRRTGAPAPARP